MRMWSAAPGFKPLRVGVVLTDLAPKAMHQPDLFDRPERQQTPASQDLDGILMAALSRIGSAFVRFLLRPGGFFLAGGDALDRRGANLFV
jgi:hypothetical protein